MVRKETEKSIKNNFNKTIGKILEKNEEIAEESLRFYVKEKIEKINRNKKES